jgi:hypothetical protein
MLTPFRQMALSFPVLKGLHIPVSMKIKDDAVYEHFTLAFESKHKVYVKMR